MSRRDWPKEIKYLMWHNNMTLTALADRLGVTKQQLSQANTGGEPSPTLKYKILDMKGYTMTRETILDLLPAQLADTIRNKDNERISTADDDEKKVADA